jgi:predicted nucleic acid-binding protein
MATMDAKRIFLDTNVLIYSTNIRSPLVNTAKAAIQKAREQGIELVVSQQILREYLAVTTRFDVIKGKTKFQNIIANVQKFQREFTVVVESPKQFEQLIQILQEVPSAGKQVHDANIVTTMVVHGIEHLLTHNVDDFERFSA